MSIKKRFMHVAGAVLAAATVGVLAVPAQPAEAAKRKCGYISCTWYFNAKETSDIKDAIAIGAVPVAFIPIAGPVAAASMAVNSGVISILANHGWCLKVKVHPVERRIEQLPYKCP